MKSLKIGLMVDSANLGGLALDLAVWAVGRDDVDVTCAFINAVDTPTVWQRLKKRGVYDMSGRAARSAILQAERKILRLGTGARAPVPPPSIEMITLTPIVKGFVYRYSDQDISAVRNSGVDVLIRCGNGILRGGILEAAPFGIISFHHGDNRVNRGGPQAFWEVYHQWAETGFTIQQLTDELDGGKVIMRGSFPTQFTYAQNLAILSVRSAPYMKKVLVELAALRALRFEAPCVYSGPLYKSPSLAHMCRYAGRICRMTGLKAWRRAFGIKPIWSLGVLRQSFPAFSLWRHKEIRAPHGKSWADPFLWQHGDRTLCLVEEYERGQRGHIAAIEITQAGAEKLGDALIEPFHLSFPYLFEFDGQILMCPETAHAKEIRIYSTDTFPLGWVHKKTIMKDVSAVDSMLFPHAGRWWLSTSFAARGGACELHLFHGDSPLATEWTPHPANPVRITPAGGRNAGMAKIGDQILRFGQYTRYGRYGAGVLVHEVTRLSETEYEEKVIASLDPNFAGIQGIHHLSVGPGVAVFDMLKYRRA